MDILFWFPGRAIFIQYGQTLTEYVAREIWRRQNRNVATFRHCHCKFIDQTVMNSTRKIRKGRQKIINKCMHVRDVVKSPLCWSLEFFFYINDNLPAQVII